MHEEAKGYSRFLTMAWKKRTWISMGSLIVDNQLRHRSARNCSHHDACEKKKGTLPKYSVLQIHVVKGCVNYHRAHATFDHVYLNS